MAITTDKIIKLLKTHITYLSLLILFTGLLLKYSLSSLFPYLNNFDITFFGGILIEFSVLLYIGNFLINKYREEINEQLFSQIIDNKLGIKNTPLLTELVNLLQPFSYNLTLVEVNSHIKKNKRNPKKYDIFEKKSVTLYPKQDNVYYVFSFGSTNKKDIAKIESVKINNKIVLSKNIKEIESAYLGSELTKTYQITIPLKKDIKYDIEIKCYYPSCMSDLTDGSESDFHEVCYFALTERTVLKYEYDFEDFKNYEFKAEKKYMNVPDIVEIPCKRIKNKKGIIVESGNLKNGDRICITYTKKK